MKDEEKRKRTMIRSATTLGSAWPVESTAGLDSRASPTRTAVCRERKSRRLLVSSLNIKLMPSDVSSPPHSYSRVAYLFLADLSAISTSNHKIDLIYDLTQNYEHLLAPLEHEPGKEDAIILPPRLNNEFFRETSIFQIFSSIGRRHGLFGSPKPEKDADIDFLDVVGRIIVKVSLDEEKTFYGEELSRMLDRLEEDKEIIAEMVAKLPASMVVPGNAEKGLAKAREIVFESIEGTI
jgi:hypothetical protein